MRLSPIAVHRAKNLVMLSDKSVVPIEYKDDENGEETEDWDEVKSFVYIVGGVIYEEAYTEDWHKNADCTKEEAWKLYISTLPQ